MPESQLLAARESSRRWSRKFHRHIRAHRLDDLPQTFEPFISDILESYGLASEDPSLRVLSNCRGGIQRSTKTFREF
jgi:hypothetical protein